MPGVEEGDAHKRERSLLDLLREGLDGRGRGV